MALLLPRSASPSTANDYVCRLSFGCCFRDICRPTCRRQPGLESTVTPSRLVAAATGPAIMGTDGDRDRAMAAHRSEIGARRDIGQATAGGPDGGSQRRRPPREANTQAAAERFPGAAD